MVCLDIQAAIAQRAGVGRYTKMLAEHLGAQAGADRLSMFYFDFQRRGTPFPVPNAETRAVRWIPGRYAQAAWKRLGWPPFDWFAGAADVYHFPNFILPPLRRGKSVVTIHDVSFLRFPHTTEARNYRYLSAWIGRTVERADAILADSAFVGREICALLNAPPEKVHTVECGLDPAMRRPAEEQILATRQRLGLHKAYLLHVGTLEPRKNIPLLIAAFERLTDFDGDLVLAGMLGWNYGEILTRIEKSAARDRIRRLDYVAENDLPALYAGATAVAMPSMYEGFGFPPLEAMACGTPVVCSSAGSLPEVTGAAAHRVESYDPDEWARAMANLLSDADLRARLVAAGAQHIRRFTWDAAAAKTWRVYRSLA